MRGNRKRWLKIASAVLMVALVLAAAPANGFMQNKRGPNSGRHNWGGSAPLRETALNTGYEAGVAAGRSDRSRNERFDFAGESDYKSASKGYNSRLGDKRLYQRYFRAGFENGYRDGWDGH